MSKFEYNGFSWDVDMLDIDTVECYENGMAAVSEKMAAVNTGEKKGYEMLREELRAVDEFFDLFLGDGAAHQMFGDSNSLRPRMEAFTQASKLADEMQADVMEFQKKTAPATNRAQRRIAAKNKK